MFLAWNVATKEEKIEHSSTLSVSLSNDFSTQSHRSPNCQRRWRAPHLINEVTLCSCKKRIRMCVYFIQCLLLLKYFSFSHVFAPSAHTRTNTQDDWVALINWKRCVFFCSKGSESGLTVKPTKKSTFLRFFTKFKIAKGNTHLSASPTNQHATVVETW